MPERDGSAITLAEARVLLLLLERRSPRDTAGELAVSVGTVRTHIKHLLAKSGTHSIAELVVWAHQEFRERLVERLEPNRDWAQRARRSLTIR